MKYIAPNSCYFCEVTKDKHGTVFNDLHPSGAWTWVEPCDKVRLERMRRNRKIRKGNTMTVHVDTRPFLSDIPAEQWIGTWVTYHGVRRQAELGGGTFKVTQMRDDRGSVGFDAGVFGIQWSAPSALKVSQSDGDAQKMTNALLDFLDPHSGTLSAIDAKIKMYEDMLHDLRKARQVIAGL